MPFIGEIVDQKIGKYELRRENMLVSQASK